MTRSTVVADLRARRVDDLLGDLVGLELAEELLGVPSLAIPLSTARLPIFAAREGTIPCQPIPPIITPGICWSLVWQHARDSAAATCARKPRKWTG